MAYIAAVAAHPAFTDRFREDLAQPGLRIPLTADGKLFARAAKLGRTIVWLHTFGERFADPKDGRPAQPPRMARDKAPRYPVEGAIPQDPDSMPDEIGYVAALARLIVGGGFIENVPREVWEYEVSGKQVLTQRFSYRKKSREKPPMGDNRPPSELSKIQPDGWLAEYTTELLNVLHILGRLVELEGPQAELLDETCSSPTLAVGELQQAGALEVPEAWRKKLAGDASKCRAFSTTSTSPIRSP